MLFFRFFYMLWVSLGVEWRYFSQHLLWCYWIGGGERCMVWRYNVGLLLDIGRSSPRPWSKGPIHRITLTFLRCTNLRFFHCYAISLLLTGVILEMLHYLSITKDTPGSLSDSSSRPNMVVVTIIFEQLASHAYKKEGKGDLQGRLSTFFNSLVPLILLSVSSIRGSMPKTTPIKDFFCKSDPSSSSNDINIIFDNQLWCPFRN